ncbi:MAG TPA: hypothetical protein VF598_06380 [Hymenobacter sp.]|jgi:hypothetical protein
MITKQYRIEIQLDDAQQQLAEAIKRLEQLDAQLEGLDRDSNAAKAIVAQMATASKQVENLTKQIEGLDASLDEIKPGSIGALRQEVERLEAELDKADLGSEAADKLVRELGKAKAELRSLDESIDVAFDKDKAGAFADAAAGVAGAFSIMTVAAQNFGLSKDSAEEYNQKLLECLNIVSSLEQLHKLTTSEVRTALKSVVGDAKNVILGYLGIGEATTAAGTAANTSAKVTRLALATLGIGAILLILGLVVTNWDKITAAVSRNKDSIVNATKYIAPPIYGIIKLLELIEKKFGGISSLAAGVGSAFKQLFSNVGDALLGVEGNGKTVAEAFHEGVSQRNAELAEQRQLEEIRRGQDGLKRQIAEQEAAGKDVYELKKKYLENELVLLDKSAADYQKLLAEKQSEIQVLTNAHLKKLADEAEKARKEEEAKQKAATEQARKVAEERYRALREAQAKATEQEAADNEERRKRLVESARAYGGSQQTILRAEINAAKDQQTEMLLNGKGYGSEWLALKTAIREKEQQIIDLNLADQKRAMDERKALGERELADLQEQGEIEQSILRRTGALERQQDEAKLQTLRKQADVMKAYGMTASAAYAQITESISDLEKKLKPKAEGVGYAIVKALFGLVDEKNDEFRRKLGASLGQLVEAGQMLNDVLFAQAQQKLDDQIEQYSAAMDAAKERSDLAQQELEAAQQRRGDLESQLDSARGTRREYLLQQIAKEQAAEAKLAREKKAADAEQLRNAKLKEDAEKRRQKLEKESQILAAATATAANVATAAEAVKAGVRAVAGANAIPFPGNLPAIIAAIAATTAAIASAKGLANSFKKEKGGLLQGPSHALGGISYGEYEVEGLEFVTNRRATLNNLRTLEQINRYGDRIEFVALPKQAISKAAQGGQLVDGNVDSSTSEAPVILTGQQGEQIINLLALVVGHTAATAAKPPVDLGPQMSRKIWKNAQQEEADASGGKLF